jgi:tetraprenyl-beta-curcumene synthase
VTHTKTPDPRNDEYVSGYHPDPAPLTARQLRVLAQAVARELAWGLPAVTNEVRHWRTRAREIPQTNIRSDALSSLRHKRGHTDGAALFCIFPAARSITLLRLLVAYEIMWDFLDSVNEKGAEAGQVNGRQLHLALIDAVQPESNCSDYYRYHPWQNDGGYLTRLVRTCRAACASLPSFHAVQPLLIREARRAQVLATNHELAPERRDAGLRRWARQQAPEHRDAHWFELSGAASASLTVHALFALAAEADITCTQLRSVCGAYFPWISAATTMLDSYVDRLEDTQKGDHSYVSHYPSAELATVRIGYLLRRALREAAQLPNSERHILIVAAMASMYLSKDSAWSQVLRDDTRRILAAGGSLPRLLLPVLRLWRIAYSQRSS